MGARHGPSTPNGKEPSQPLVIGPLVARYGVAVAAVGLALVIKLLLDPLIGQKTPFLLFLGAIGAVAYLGGLGPGLVATGLAALLAWYFFLFPTYSFRIESFGQGLRLVVFVLEGTLVGLLVAMLRSARLRAAISTRQAREDRKSLREGEERYRFLAEARAALSSSLDYRVTLTKVAHLTVPQLADWCAVDVLGEDGSLERLAVAHQDPEKVALAYELQERYPPDPDASYGVLNVLRTGEPEMMSEIPPELVKESARDAEHREILRTLGLRSYVLVPMIARGRTLGTIAFVTAESGRRYGDADLKLAEDLARRAAVAVDNARLYEEAQREIAEREQAEEKLRSSRDELEIYWEEWATA